MKSKKKIEIILVFLTILLGLVPINYLFNNVAVSNNGEVLKPKLNNGDQLTLLHSYDFEDDVVGQDPTGITLSVNDPADSGTVNVDNLGDEQQNHVALHKSGGSKLIQLTDNLSYYGDEYDAGELHFKFYHDNSLFGIHFRGSTGLLFAIDLWAGIVGRHGVGITYTTYTINQWTELKIYYNISLGWMFEINGVRFGDGYSYSFEHENPSGLELIQWRSAYTGTPYLIGYLRIDDIAFYYEGIPEITHIFIDDLDPNNNWDQALNRGWCTGSGTWSDPYVIENFIIDASGSPTGSGILIKNSITNYFHVRNCTVYKARDGLLDAAIELENTNNGIIIGNNFSRNGYWGIIAKNCRNNAIIRNNITNNKFGIHLKDYSEENDILDNVINYNRHSGIHLSWHSDYNIISGNSINHNDIGIYLARANGNNNISRNTINNNTGEGIFLLEANHNNLILENIVYYNGIGIFFQEVNHYNRISGNTINYNTQGIYFDLDNCYNYISENILNCNDRGIYFSYGNGFNEILRNTVSENAYGILLEYSRGNLISENIVDFNAYGGIILNWGSSSNTIEMNSLHFNLDFAIAIKDLACQANIVRFNYIHSTDGKFIEDSGTNTAIISNYLISESARLFVEFVTLWFSTTEFVITLKIFREYDFSISLDIQMWWNGIVVPSNNITELGDGLYEISLNPILVAPDEDPILLNMTISADYHFDKYYEVYIGVDPEAVFKGNTPAGSDVEIIDEITGVNVTFSEVTNGGTTIIEKSEEGPEPPSGFEVAGDYYNITTDASFSGVIAVAFPYNESKVIDEENLKILHRDPSTGWTDVTTWVDTVNNIVYGEFTSLSTFIVLEKVEHEYIIWEIDQLIEKIKDSSDNCWEESSKKDVMENKLIELKDLAAANELVEAYDKLLHDIKPKLTGLKSDENEVPWGNGIFKNPWVTCPHCQEEYRSDCNTILNHLAALHMSLAIGALNLYETSRIIYMGSSIIGLLGIALMQYFRSKQKLNPLRTEAYMSQN